MQNQHLLSAVLVGLLGSGPAVAAASALAVGNSWTYDHLYADQYNVDVYTRWTNYDLPQRSIWFTLSVLRTEDIDGQT